MDVKVLRQLNQSSLTPDCRYSSFRLEGRAVVPARSSCHGQRLDCSIMLLMRGKSTYPSCSDFRSHLSVIVSSVLRKDPSTGTAFVFRSCRAYWLKLLYWAGSGLVLACRQRVGATFPWPAIGDGVLALNYAQFGAMFAGLDWRRVEALETRPPAAAE